MAWMALRALAPLGMLLAASGCAHTPVEDPAQSASDDYVGLYDGSGFEVFAGLELAPDHTFTFGVMVGSLDARAQGTWEQRGDGVVLTSVPKPVPAEFSFSGLSDADNGAMVAVTLPECDPFPYLEVIIGCADGSVEYLESQEHGWSPPSDECGIPIWIELNQLEHEVRSQRYALEELGWQDAKTLEFIFTPNDLGMLDFTGVTARMDGDTLLLTSPLGESEMRKVKRASDD